MTVAEIIVVGLLAACAAALWCIRWAESAGLEASRRAIEGRVNAWIDVLHRRIQAERDAARAGRVKLGGRICEAEARIQRLEDALGGAVLALQDGLEPDPPPAGPVDPPAPPADPCCSG